MKIETTLPEMMRAIVSEFLRQGEEKPTETISEVISALMSTLVYAISCTNMTREMKKQTMNGVVALVSDMEFDDVRGNDV